MKFLSRLCVAAAIGAASLWSHAALVSSHYTQIDANRWTVDLGVTNDNAQPPLITGFTIYFSEDLFSGLTLLAAPAAWDSLVIQPDPMIPDAGFLDAFVLDAADALALGQSQSGFRVSFDWLGAGLPQALYFEIVDEDFNVLASGDSQVSVAQAVPEPGSLALAALGLAALWGRRRMPARGAA